MKFNDNEAVKVLFREPDGSLWSCHGGDFQWTLGEWTPEVPDPKLGVSGYHITKNPQGWWWRDTRTVAFLCEYLGNVDGKFEDSWKSRVAVGSCRLIRELTDGELGSMGVFMKGTHKVANTGINGQVLVGGTAKVEAVNAWVEAYGKAVVTASGSSRLTVADEVIAHTTPGVMIFPVIGFKGQIHGGGYISP